MFGSIQLPVVHYIDDSICVYRLHAQNSVKGALIKELKFDTKSPA